MQSTVTATLLIAADEDGSAVTGDRYAFRKRHQTGDIM